jgi:hypothetical protein
MFFPSIHPKSDKASKRAVVTGAGGPGPGLREPIARTFPPCCARAASGQEPRSVMNARRSI